MPTRNRLLPMILAAAAIGTASIGLADDVAPSSAAPKTVNVNFEGGTLADFANLLMEANPNYNIVIQDEAADFPIQPMELRNVSVAGCIWILDNLEAGSTSESRRLWSDTYGDFPRATIVVIGQQARTRSQAARNTARSSQRIDLDEYRTEVFSVGNLLGSGFTSQMILDNIAMAQSLEDTTASRDAKCRINDDTGLLFVRATRQQVDVVIAVLDAMADSQPYRYGLKMDQSQPEFAPTPPPPPSGIKAPEAGEVKFFTAVELKLLTLSELREQLVKISTARKRARGNAEKTEQLQNQFNMVMDELQLRMDED